MKYLEEPTYPWKISKGLATLGPDKEKLLQLIAQKYKRS